MPKLTRIYHKIFGLAGTTDNFGQFGGTKAGAPTATKDLTSIQSLAAWDNGWQDAVIGGDKAAALEEMNALLYAHSRQTGYIFESGIPEWDASTTYYIGSVVRVGAYWYMSLADGNINNTPPAAASDAKWLWANSPQTPPGSIQYWPGLTPPTGWLLADGSALSRASYAPLLAAVTQTITGVITNGSAVVTGIASTASLRAGFPLSGVGLPGGATIATVDSPTQITMSGNASASQSTAILVAPWGVGDGSTTFNLPNLNDGAFLRSLGSTYDSGRIFGSIQTDAFQGHKHTVVDPGHTHNVNRTGTPADGSKGTYVWQPVSPGGGANSPDLYPTALSNTTGITVTTPISDGSNGTPRLAAETRPVNRALPVIIKY